MSFTRRSFYFGDTGVVDHLTRRGRLERGGELFGKGLESWVHHELRSHLLRRDTTVELTYWRLTTGAEVDFLLEDLSLAIEVKAGATIVDQHLRGLRQLSTDQPKIRQRVLFCLVPKRRVTSDGILILPAGELSPML